MRYSVDLRKRVLQFIKEGGSKSQAARMFKVSRASVYNWLGMDDLSAYQRSRPSKAAETGAESSECSRRGLPG